MSQPSPDRVGGGDAMGTQRYSLLTLDTHVMLLSEPAKWRDHAQFRHVNQ